MPNWCENDLTITGDPDEIRRLLEFIKTEAGDFDFNTILPYPERFSDMDSGGYGWCVNQWGTKWNACDVKVEFQGKDEVLISFNTAWSPPLPVIEALGGAFRELRFELKYYEYGMGYQGEYSVEGGEVCANIESKYEGERGG